MTLLAFAADRRPAEDVDRKAAAPVADAQLHSSRSILLDPQQQTRRRCSSGRMG